MTESGRGYQDYGGQGLSSPVFMVSSFTQKLLYTVVK